MNLKFLLDEHFSPKIIDILQSLDPPFETSSILTLNNGDLRGESDESLLSYCKQEGYLLITADLNTIPAVLKSWSDQGQEHAGAVFISNKSLPANHHSRIAKSLVKLVEQLQVTDYTNAVYFLR